jgi:o-succinylbenzoate---CoA ligase
VDPLRLSEIEPHARQRVALVVRRRALTFAQLATLASAVDVPRPCFVARAEIESLLQLYAGLDRGVPVLPAQDAKMAIPAAEASPPAVWIATSGTSGEPKLVTLDRAAVIASARASAENLGWRDDDRWLLCLPFCHVGGLGIITRCLVARRTVVAVPRFDPADVLDAIVREHVTLLSVVPTMLRALLDEDRENRLSRLRAVLVGGAAFDVDLRGEAAARGVVALATYGASEMGSQITTQRLDGPHGSLDSGFPLPGAEIDLAADGRIRVRGPMRMRGYWGERDLAPEDWFETGDLGAVDEKGRLVVTGRADDMIVTGGENVHPSLVERAMAARPGVRAALAFGVPDPRFGARVAVALVLEPGVSAEDVLASVVLPSAAKPRAFVQVSALPENASGKLDRRRAARLFECALRSR